MQALITKQNYIICEAHRIEFGAWDEPREKWAMFDENNNIYMYFIDQDYTLVTYSDEDKPDDFDTSKYLYVDGEFVLNLDWREPEPSIESRVDSLEDFSAEMLYQLCLLQLGLDEEDFEAEEE